MNNEQEKLNGCENCDGCAEEKKTPETIPYIVHETTVARMERTVKRMWVLLILLVVLLTATNGAWIWHESQFEDIYQEVTQDAESGTNNFIFGDNYGEANDKNEGQNP